MHRHSLFVASPPPAYVACGFALAPWLPEFWDGDCWTNVVKDNYHLRAWSCAREISVAGNGPTFESALAALMKQIWVQALTV